mgnify:CR=1 FL=1
MTKPKAIYLIQEKGCLNSFSGAFQHITMGVKELSKYFDIELQLNDKKIILKAYTKKTDKVLKTKKRGSVYGTIKDVFILLKNLLKVRGLVKQFKKKKPHFIYERVSYLDFSGLIASKVCSIPHFYEANGLQFKTRETYYKSMFYQFAKSLERLALKKSTYSFFVGSYGDYWKIKKSNWSNVENGIEAKMIQDVKNLNKIDDGILHLCFIGRYAKHQKVELLIEAISQIKQKDKMHIHLIGSGLENMSKEILANDVMVTNHGFLNRSEIMKITQKCHIGLICGTPPYQSCMKLYDYAISGCAVLSPMVHNLKFWFDNCLIYFDGTSEGLAIELENCLQNFDKVTVKSKLLNSLVINNFTWEMIFAKKVAIIKKACK